MAIRGVIDYSKAPLQDTAITNLSENLLKGYKMGQEPAKMRDEAELRKMTNELKKLDLEHKPKEYELNDQAKELANALSKKANEHYEEKFNLDKQVKQSTIDKNNRPEMLKGALAAAYQLREKLNPDDPDFDKKKKEIDNYITKLGTVAGVTPEAAPGQGIKIDLPEGKEGYIPGIGKLKQGWQAVKDIKGNTIGVNVPMTEKMVDQFKAKEKFDVIYPFMNKSFAEYSGKGSWERYVNDAKNYNKDPEAKQRIDNFNAARKLVSIGSTTENARIGGHATNVQLDELKNTLDSSEVYKKLEKGSTVILPSKYTQASGDLFKSYLDKVEKTAKTNIPAYEFRALNPGQNSGNVAPTGTTNPEGNLHPTAKPERNTTQPEIIKTENGFTTIKNGSKTLKIPIHLVDKYMIEHAPKQFGGQYE